MFNVEDEINKALVDVKVRFGKEENPEKAEITDGLQGKFNQLDEEGNTLEGGHEHTGFFKIEDLKSAEIAPAGEKAYRIIPGDDESHWKIEDDSLPGLVHGHHRRCLDLA